MEITAFDLAQRFVAMAEIPGVASNPAILAMLKLDDQWPTSDEVPWCSAFVNYICWLLRLPRSKSLAARSWLEVGMPVNLDDAQVGFDVVILSREGGGHVGFFAGRVQSSSDSILKPGVFLLGGNQGNKVCIESFCIDRVIGVRRLA